MRQELWAVWVTAGATILAAIVPGVLFLLERKDRKAAQAELRAERRRADDLERRALQAQARRVRLTAFRPEVTNEYGDVEYLDFYTSVTARNGLDDPIFNVVIGGVPVHASPGDSAVVEPGDVLPVALVDQHPASQGYPPVWVEFTDVRGRRWRRYSDGAVTEHTPGHENTGRAELA